MKKFLVTLLSVLMLVTCVAFTACDSCNSDKPVKDMFKTYLLKQDGQPLDEDFVLDLKVKDRKVNWTSSDTSAIEIEERKEDYLAKVKLGDEAKNVKLTVSCGEEKKDFNVTVVALDVYYLVENFKLEKDGQTVYDSFDLPTSYTYKGATATIVWEIDDVYHQYIKLNDDGNKCLVTPTSLNPEVELKASFTYKGVSTEGLYRVTVSLQREHLEQVAYWYTHTGVACDLSGYVVAINEAYSDFGNATFYIIDDDFCCGYYVYRSKTDAENGALLDVGVHVTVKGTTNKDYNGLFETDNAGNFTVDKDENGNVKKIDNIYDYVYALDNDLLADVPSVIHNQSRLVSLDKWTVKSINNEPSTDKGKSPIIFTLTKGDKDVPIVISKYLGGSAYKIGDDAYKALVNLSKTLKVGDVVSVTGLLGNYKGHQIAPLKVDDVQVAAEGTEATAIPDFCEKINTAVTAVNKVFTNDVITANKDITIPQTEGVTITCRLLKESSSVVLNGNVLTVTVGDEENLTVEIKYTVGDYTTVTFHSIHSKKVTDEGTVNDVKAGLTLGSTLASGYELKASEGSATITWALKADVAGVSIASGKINNTASEDKEVTLVATITCGTASATKEFTVTVSKATSSSDTELTGTFNVVLDLTNAADQKKKFYFTGALSGNYGATSENAADAGEVVVAEATGGYTIKVGEKYLEVASYDNNGKTSYKVVLVDASTGVWTYNSEVKVFTFAVGSVNLYLGTYTNTSTNKTFTTVSASNVTYISGDNASKIGVSQFPISFVKPGSGSTTPTEPSKPTEPETPTTPTPVPTDGSTLDFVTKFSEYAGNWDSSYTSREVTFALTDTKNVTVTLSNANKQGSTITDRPVLAAKNNTQYITIDVTDLSVTAVEFALAQWTTKTFTDIHIEYTTDGTTWTACSETITTPGTLASNAAIPAGATAIRLSVSTTNSGNTQLGLSSIKLTIA